MFTNTQREVNRSGTRLVNRIIQGLNAKGKNASGKLARSTKFKFRSIPSLITFEIKAQDYWKYVDQGRKPGKMPPEAPILKWISQKGLGNQDDKGLAFLIRRKIAREGIKPTFLFTNSIKLWKRDDLPRIREALTKDVTKETRKNIE